MLLLRPYKMLLLPLYFGLQFPARSNYSSDILVGCGRQSDRFHADSRYWSNQCPEILLSSYTHESKIVSISRFNYVIYLPHIVLKPCQYGISMN